VLTGTPSGFRDILPEEALVRERICATVRECFSSHGYQPVETPLLEYRDVLERGSSIQDTPFQLFDTTSDLLVLRPDLTLPMARVVASRVERGQLPVRLRSEAAVVREESSLKGQPRQFTQLDVELVGERPVTSELEVVRLLAEVLDKLEVPDWRIVCGSVSPLVSLVDACAPSKEFRRRVLELVHESDLVTLDEYVESAEGLTEAQVTALHKIPRAAGGLEVIEAIDALLEDAGVPSHMRGTRDLALFAGSLGDMVGKDRLSFDFSIINSFDYYTGIVFKAYAEGIAASLGSGGRYDAVLGNLGRENLVACGFALSLERLQEVLGEPGESGVVTPGVRMAERPLRIAVPKGALLKPTLKVLEAAGLPIEGLRDPGRHLTVREGDYEYVIVRATDAPTFVGHGGADCGICGTDTLAESGIDLLQLVDLGYGRCHFVLAEPADARGRAERNYAWRGTMRVATKYPRITKAYYDRIGQQVDVITLHGNIELGPIVGMADRIVDITETGTTLRENDLVVVADDILEVSARFFAGPAAYRCDRRIRGLVTRLAEAAKRG